jgi:transketolase
VSTKAVRQQFADTMLEVGREDPRLVVLVGDISHFALQPFAKVCRGRYYNVGICEPTIVSMAGGLAKMGFHPVVHTIAPFLVERSFEQIKLDFCYHDLGGSLVTVGSVFDYSNLGCTHHCYDDFALLKALPGAQICVAASPAEFDRLFRQSYRNRHVTLLRICGHQHGVEFCARDIELGKGIRMTEGADLTVVATGPQLRSALDARDELAVMGFETEIIYVHTIRPLDEDLVRASVRKTRRVLVVEEHMRSGGLGDEVLRITHDLGGIEFESLAVPDRFVRDYGPYEHHCARLGLSREGIVAAARARFSRRPVASGRLVESHS